MRKSVALSLYDEARKASKNTYSPYSKFPVGAAVLTKNGNVFYGTNIENASYGLTICAERSAICNAVSNGVKDIISIAIYSKKRGISPCGACRQFILEFGGGIDVIFRNNNRLVIKKIKDLVPDGFSRKDLL